MSGRSNQWMFLGLFGRTPTTRRICCIALLCLTIVASAVIVMSQQVGQRKARSPVGTMLLFTFWEISSSICESYITPPTDKTMKPLVHCKEHLVLLKRMFWFITGRFLRLPWGRLLRPHVEYAHSVWYHIQNASKYLKYRRLWRDMSDVFKIANNMYDASSLYRCCLLTSHVWFGVNCKETVVNAL